ncbi:uncharacterized protein G2W53_009604 [Senna tora]|uniref:Uncharacterized protein n=1 Tax=Senna tora TaxID=362788 RepID=A0A834WYK3_9FABA|nr:uncharacterized protein G2W53_009604 [Senna tora]
MPLLSLSQAFALPLVGKRQHYSDPLYYRVSFLISGGLRVLGSLDTMLRAGFSLAFFSLSSLNHSRVSHVDLPLCLVHDHHSERLVNCGQWIQIQDLGPYHIIDGIQSHQELHRHDSIKLIRAPMQFFVIYSDGVIPLSQGIRFPLVVVYSCNSLASFFLFLELVSYASSFLLLSRILFTERFVSLRHHLHSFFVLLLFCLFIMSDTRSEGSTTGGSTKQNADDGAFQLHNSDHPGMALVMSPP